MIVVSINWPSSGTEYYTINASQDLIALGYAQTKPKLVSVSDISRAISAGSNGIENSSVTVTLGDGDGYFGAKLGNTDQFIKGRKLVVYDYDTTASTVTVLFTGYITQMGEQTATQFSLTADLMTGALGVPINNKTLNKVDYPTIYSDSFIGLSKPILYGNKPVYQAPVYSPPGVVGSFNYRCYRTSAGKYFVARHACSSIGTTYGRLNLTDVTLTQWGGVGGRTTTIDNNADGNCYITASADTADGILYVSTIAGIYDGGGTIDDPASILNHMVTNYCGLTLEGYAAAYSWYFGADWALWGGSPGAFWRVGTFGFIINNQITLGEFLNYFQAIADCDIVMQTNGNLKIVPHDYPTLIAATLGVVNEYNTVSGSFKYWRDMQNFNSQLQCLWGKNCDDVYAYTPMFIKTNNSWQAGLKALNMDAWNYPPDISGGGYETQLISARRWFQRNSRPNVYYSFTVSRDYAFGTTKAINLNLGDVLTINHAENRIYPSTARPAQIVGITITPGADTVTLKCLDLYLIQDRIFLACAGQPAGCNRYMLLAPGSAHKLT
jgi:hypothetical protein